MISQFEIDRALMAGAAYFSTRDPNNRFPIPQGWAERVENRVSDESSGFEARAFQKGNEIVISYAGTDPGDLSGDMAANFGLATGAGSVQLQQAAEYYLQVQAANPNATITFTGHSLGGGLAALMGVFFGKQALTFDQAPFANSAEASLILPDVAANLRSHLVDQLNLDGTRKYSDTALQGLTDFLAIRAAIPLGEISNHSLVQSINVQGEFLSGAPWNTSDRIGLPSYIPTHAPGVSGFDLHSQALLTAFLQSMQTAPSQCALNDVTFKLTDLMGMIFSPTLYKFETDTAAQNFLERLVQNETGNAMVTRFTSDLWKLAQDGGLTMADDSFASVKLVSQTLIAFAMQMYYENTANAANKDKELFAELSAGSSGGIRFDLADVTSDPLSTTKGYSLYFHDYVANSFSPGDRDRIYAALPGLRDWYVQAGRNGMEATDTQNRGAFMLGGLGADVLTGGSGNDLVVGNVGHDRLTGGAGMDTLMGGTGFDIYYWNTGDGNDRIEDADARGMINVNGQVLLGGVKKANHSYWENADGSIRYEMSGTDLVVKLNGTTILTVNEDFESGQFGIRLVDLPTFGEATRTEFLKIDHYDATPAGFVPVYAEFFDDTANDTRNTATIGGLVAEIGDENNLIYAGGGSDYIISGNGDDQLYGDGGADEIYGGLGNDRLYGGSEADQLFGDNVAVSTSGGNDFLDGGDGNDLVQGGAGRDLVFGGAGNDNLNGDEFTGDNSGGFDDYLDGGTGDDELHGAAGSDVLIGGVGNDLLIGDTTQFQNGTPEQGGNDSLDGGEGQDQLFGLYGDDLLLGGAGNDLVNGQDGSDVLYGGEGADTLSGDLRFMSLAGGYDTREWRAAGGDDLLYGGAGVDLLSGGEGNDILDGGTDDDQLYGDYLTSQVSTGDPLYWTLFSALGEDWISGGAGNDTLSGGFGADVLLGGEGSDSLYGGESDDRLEGGAGDDVLYGEYAFNASEFILNPFIANIRALSGDDVLDGGEGNDVLQGGEGTDTLLGGAGNDTLRGETGNDFLDGGDGVDTLDGGVGVDLVHGGAGNDRLLDFQGGDTLYGDDGDDILISAHESITTGDSLLVGGSGNDTYEIDSLGDTLVEAAGDGIDTVISYMNSYTLADYFENLSFSGRALVGVGNSLDNVMSGAESLEGLGGNDTLIGAGRLDGGIGDDVLQGRPGLSFFNDDTGQLEYLVNTYVFRLGDGRDTIQEHDAALNSAYYQNEDRVSFAAGIAPSDVTWQRNGNDLLLRVGGGTDQINISSFYDLRLDRGGYMVNGVTVPPQGIVSTSSGFPSYVAPSRVELVQFADGTVWDASYFGAPLLGDFRVDTYRFGRGAGEVSVIDFDFWQSNATRELDSILIAADLSPSDLTVSRVGDDLALAVNGTTDSLTIQSFFKTVTVIPPFSSSGYAVAVYQIEQVQFANGTVWTVSDLNSRIATFIGTPGADTLFGNQNDNFIQGLSGDDFLSGQGGHDVLDGGAGNDRLFGDTGSDTYLFGRGSGQDILVSYDSTGTEMEVVRLGSDVLPADVTIQVVGTSNDLVLRINGTSDQLLLDEFLWRSDYQIDWLEFGDGTLWDTAMILNRAMGLTLVGTDVNNTLRGSMLDDVLDGVGGNDLLVGNEGDDRLIGGVGDDELSGDAGDDTYVFNLGDGVDTVYDEVAPGEANRIQFGAGIAQSDLAFTRDKAARTLTIQVGGGANQLRLMDFDPTGADGSLVVETLVFADGSMLNLAELYPPVTNHAPTLATPLADQIVPEDAPFSIQIPTNSFADQDTNDVLTYGASLADGNTLPSWLMFNVTTQTFTGLADDAQVGNLDLSVTVTDSEGLSASDAFTLTVQNVNDAPIVAVPLADQTGAEDEPFSFTVPAGTFADEDGIHGDTLSYRASLSDGRALPAWLSFNPVTRTFTGTPGAGTAGMLQLAVTATDTGALTTTDVFALTISGPLPKTFIGTAGNDVLMGARGNDTLRGLGGQDTLYGKEGNDWLDGGSGSDTLVGGMGDDTYVVNATGDVVTELAGEGLDTVRTSLSSYTLGAHLENLTLTGGITSVGVGNALNNTLVGDAGSNLLSGGAGNDVLQGGAGIDVLAGGTGNDLYQFFRGDGRDVIRDKDTTAGNHDRLAFGTTINPLDLILERQANDLRMRVYGSQDQVLIDSWYSTGTVNHLETIQASNGQTLLSSQVDQLIQAMATFTQQTGLTWDQAIDQRPQDVQAVLAGSWQG